MCSTRESHSEIRTAAGYVRMSTDYQKESPVQQREQISRQAARMGFQQIRWYADEAVSGNDLRRRLGFQQLIHDAVGGLFQTIICWSLNRFGRFDSIEGAQWVGKLRSAGVSLVTVAEGEMNWDDAAGRLTCLMHQEQKHTFLLDRARDITRGIQRRAMRPGFYTGTPPYSYDRLVFDEQGKLQRRVVRGETFVKPKSWTARLALTEDKAVLRVIRWIFIAFANGRSQRSIALTLNMRRRPSPGGKHWRLGTVRAILENPTYTGDQVFNRRHSGKYFGICDSEVVPDGEFNLRGTRNSIQVFNSKDEWIVVANDHPKIIDRKTFGRVESRLRGRTGVRRPKGYDPLTGLVFCGHCGARMYIQTSSLEHFAGRRLVCRTASDKGRTICKVRSIDERLFLIFLTSLLSERVFGPRWEDGLVKRLDIKKTSIADRSIYRHDYDRHSKAAVNDDNPERVIAEMLVEFARVKFAIESSDFALLRPALRAVIGRIDIWFGSHPRMRNASKLIRGNASIATAAS